jgi:NADPH:quinone reductase-like Zn-dependent oxidoreductase
MKAATINRYGSEEVIELKDVERPKPNSNQLLVKVHCTTVNRTDCAFISGQPIIARLITGILKPKINITGTDFAGTVTQVGANVNSFKIDERVFGFNDLGLKSHAEYLVIDQSKTVEKIPDGISFQEAVASTEGSHYALNMINKVEIDQDAKVLVNGATGAIGSALIQILKSQNIYVTAVGNTPNLDQIKAMGADRVFDYLKEDFTLDKQKYAFVFDAVGKSSFKRTKHLLADNGAYLSTELGRNWENVWLALFTPIIGKKKVIFPIPKDCKHSIQKMVFLLEQKKFKPLIDNEFKLNQIQEAIKYVRDGKKSGNVILEMPPEVR